MLTVMTSGKAAPGTTTSTWALAMVWPSPVLVVDCDPAGGDMVPGMLAGRVPLDRGLLSWSVSTRRATVMDATMALLSHVVSIPEVPGISLLPGIQNAAQVAALDVAGWQRLASTLEVSSAAIGRDVLVDTGRLVEASCWPVLRIADRVILNVRPTVRSIHAALAAAARLRVELGDLRTVSVLVIGRGPYSSTEVAHAIGAPLLGELPDDRGAADVLSDGALSGLRGLHRTKLLRAARLVAQEIARTSMARPTVGAAR